MITITAMISFAGSGSTR